jgi:predicted PurR-regulated permease PerM
MSTELRHDEEEPATGEPPAGKTPAGEVPAGVISARRVPIDGGDPAPGEEPLADRNSDIVAAAEAEAQELGRGNHVLGTPGPPMNRRSPFMIGLLGAAGVAVTYGLVQLTVVAADILGLIGLSLFLAVGLEPAVAWLARRHIPRGIAVALVSVAIIAVVVTFLATAIPLLTAQVEAFVTNLPTYVTQMTQHSASLRRLDARFHIQQNVTQLIKSGNPSLNAGLLTAGKAVLTGAGSTVIVIVLTVYLLFDLPRIRRLIYRLTPASRRSRAILIGDEMSNKVGRYVLGNLFTSLIAGVGTLVWLLAWGVPYPFVLALTVAVLDLIPIVGSTVAGVGASLVALTVSLPVAVATAIFFIGYRFLEDYLIVPRVIGRAVEVPATATVIAVLIGGTALGVIGALVAIPAAAAIDVLLRETVYPRLDRT